MKNMIERVHDIICAQIAAGKLTAIDGEGTDECPFVQDKHIDDAMDLVETLENQVLRVYGKVAYGDE